MLIKIISPKLGESVDLDFDNKAQDAMRVLRLKDSSTRTKIAELMKKISTNVTYDKSNRHGLINAGKEVNFDFYKIDLDGVATDNAAAIRFCLLANGIEVGDFNTAVESEVLEATGKFDSFEYVNSLTVGDILVTKTPGDTAIVVDIEEEKPAEKPGLARYGSTDTKNIRKLQRDLNYVMKANIKVDGDYNEETKDMMIQFKSKYDLTPNSDYDLDAYNKMKELLR